MSVSIKQSQLKHFKSRIWQCLKKKIRNQVQSVFEKYKLLKRINTQINIQSLMWVISSDERFLSYFSRQIAWWLMSILKKSFVMLCFFLQLSWIKTDSRFWWIRSSEEREIMSCLSEHCHKSVLIECFQCYWVLSKLFSDTAAAAIAHSSRFSLFWRLWNSSRLIQRLKNNVIQM